MMREVLRHCPVSEQGDRVEGPRLQPGAFAFSEAGVDRMTADQVARMIGRPADFVEHLIDSGALPVHHSGDFPDFTAHSVRTDDVMLWLSRNYAVTSRVTGPYPASRSVQV